MRFKMSHQKNVSIEDSLLFTRRFNISIIAKISAAKLPFNDLMGNYPKIQIKEYLAFKIFKDTSERKLTRDDDNRERINLEYGGGAYFGLYSFPELKDSFKYFYEMLNEYEDTYFKSSKIMEPYNVPKILPKKEYRTPIEIEIAGGNILFLQPSCIFSTINECFEPALSLSLYDANLGETNKILLSFVEVRTIHYLLRNIDLISASRILVNSYLTAKSFIRNKKFVTEEV